MQNPQVVYHLEMPRGLSVTVKPWRQSLFRELNRHNVNFIQRDLNPHFWRWILADSETGLYENFLNTDHQFSNFNLSAIENTVKFLNRYNLSECTFNLSGTNYDPDISSSSLNILKCLEQNRLEFFFRSWLNEVADQCQEADLISLSVGSPDELVFAALIADHFRRVAPEKHSVLTLHRWENYTLKPYLKKLAFEGQFLNLFDSIITREDKAGEALASLCLTLSTGNFEHLSYIITLIDDEPRLFEQGEISKVSFEPGQTAIDRQEENAIADFLTHLGLPSDKLLMVESFIQNDCHYAKCTFCVQNLGYHKHQQFKYTPELERSITLIEHLNKKHGIRFFTFADQALADTLTLRICNLLEDKRLDIQWCCRMLPEHAILDPAALQRMANNGCKEILVGLESTSSNTLKKMGKSPNFDENKTLNWIEQCQNIGIDVTLSTIRYFPTESDQIFQSETSAFLKRCLERFDNLSVIVNTFNLFRGSQIANSPNEYGIKLEESENTDLAWVLEYKDKFGRTSQSNDENPNSFFNLNDDTLYVLYSSIGLLHKWRTGISLLSSNNDQNTDNGSSRNNHKYPNRDELIIGSEGYLGLNLASALDESKIIRCSKRLHSTNTLNAPYVSSDLIRQHRKLDALSPRKVWLCARPYCDQFITHEAFNSNIKKLLTSWAEQGSLKCVVFFSTQLVMHTPAPGQLAQGSDPLSPQAPYDYAKAELELFLNYLARQYDLDIEIIRLPLLWGGKVEETHKQTQFLHVWKESLKAGDFWNIEPGTEKYGNSWVDVQDLVQSIQNERGPGCRTRTVKSGDFTYSQLQEHWGKRGKTHDELMNDGCEMPLYETEFFLVDEVGLPQRNLLDN